MIVYGDPSYEATLGFLTERLQSRFRSLPPDPSLDDLRALLIEVGQLEQAVHDFYGGEAVARCQAVTDGLARAFLQRWSGREPVELPSLEDLPSGDERVTVKVPEGFAFYGLYPEGYVVAAQRWLASARPAEPVAVIGIRSIGTTLSAVVLATLMAGGVPARRFTVRPTGHPFERELSIDPSFLQGARWALIVDEGPGLSGSSMASVAEAVSRAGIPRDRIVFFPGHGGEPGTQTTAAVRAWWASTPRFFTRTESLRWDGRTLEEVLAKATGNVECVYELTGGEWREFAVNDCEEWPSVANSFEKRKLLLPRCDGSGVLWKFNGLGHDAANSLLGFTPQIWQEGHVLRRADVTPKIAAQIGQYISSTAGPPLLEGELKAAGERMENVLYWNTLESPGPTVQLKAPDCRGHLTSPDGRLAPWEWRRLSDEEIVKVDRVGPTIDHTIVGRQPIAWDLAGAIVEWDMDEEAESALLANAPAVGSEALRFYRLAYAAFRMGMCNMCAGMSEAPEARRLRRDEAFYRNAILRLVLADLPPLS